jgi:hypothetical protein
MKKTKIPKTAPEKVWIIMDPLDGVHLFTNQLKADKTLDHGQIQRR